jgi:hypothetical protein
VPDSTTLKLRDAKAAELLAKGFAALPADGQAATSPAAPPTAAPVQGQKKQAASRGSLCSAAGEKPLGSQKRTSDGRQVEGRENADNGQPA